jgi:AraC family transcriptional regulator
MSVAPRDHFETAVSPTEVSSLLADLVAELRVAMRRDPANADLCLDRFEMHWLQTRPKPRLPNPPAVTQGGLAPWQTLRVTRHVEENLTDRMSVSALASLARLSNTYFARAFKASLGCTPHAYIIKRRVEQAKRILLESDAPLSQIALDCGMADQAHLSRLFRRLVGETPSVWRRRNRAPSHAHLTPKDHSHRLPTSGPSHRPL